MKKNQVQKSIAKKLSWQKGGASRIAYDKRMQDKKTSSVVDQTGEFRRLMEDHRTSQPAAKVIGHPRTELACGYYKAACQLLLADQPDFRQPAEALIAQANAIWGNDL